MVIVAGKAGVRQSHAGHSTENQDSLWAGELEEAGAFAGTEPLSQEL